MPHQQRVSQWRNELVLDRRIRLGMTIGIRGGNGYPRGEYLLPALVPVYKIVPRPRHILVTDPRSHGDFGGLHYPPPLEKWLENWRKVNVDMKESSEEVDFGWRVVARGDSV
ncbi:hypothetical protein PIB30_006622 [Stylosanthes scabra]|uniref:Uncharacterized protein n=1 Tax=Stylosanthes scabra TaxID=79078 RepID=A0ABU6Q5H5_9FABA|nr:hypothetical protein [Stylosanthes scabra]